MKFYRNGNVSDISLSDNEDDLEQIVGRIGADVVKKGDAAHYNNILESQIESEDILDYLEGDAESSEQASDTDNLTDKKNIRWQASNFVNPDTNWENKQGSFSGDILTPMAYFQRHLGDEIFESVVTFTNIYAMQKKIWGATEIQI